MVQNWMVHWNVSPPYARVMELKVAIGLNLSLKLWIFYCIPNWGYIPSLVRFRGTGWQQMVPNMRLYQCNSSLGSAILVHKYLEASMSPSNSWQDLHSFILYFFLYWKHYCMRSKFQATAAKKIDAENMHDIFGGIFNIKGHLTF